MPHAGFNWGDNDFNAEDLADRVYSVSCDASSGYVQKFKSHKYPWMKCIGASYAKHLYFQIVGSLLHLVDAIAGMAGMACNVDPRHISVSPLSSLFG